jgi:arginase
MGLAIATGRCWQTLARTIPGFNPVPEANILHIGARDLDQEEEKLLQQSEIEVIRPSETIYQAVETAFHRLQDSVTRVYLHVDMDILDAGDALPNRFAVPGGLSVETVEEIIRMTQEKFEVCAGALTSFEPEYDKGNRILDAGMRIAEAFVA